MAAVAQTIGRVQSVTAEELIASTRGLFDRGSLRTVAM
jgi:hypothetical protein